MASETGTIITRFAPSPTGYLHLGGARTALFNWLYARHHGGKALLRIEDTDAKRSTQDAIDKIIEGLDWLGLSFDEEPVFQSQRAQRHAEVANILLAHGHAYKCYATPEELEAMRAEQRANKQPMRYDGRWRDREPGTDQEGAPFTVRLKVAKDGETAIEDQVQGRVTVRNEEIDDYILLRADGTPTYMLAVVVDDHDMGVTHVIRGDDHLNNAARQMGIYTAMGWDVPVWAHIPLIHGPDGKKLSKRHGAVGLEEYQTMGYPAAGMRNYLARLGWSHGDDEVFTDAQAQEWFDLSGIGKSPARLDFKKLENICGQQIAMADDAALLHEIAQFRAAVGDPPLTAGQADGLGRAMYCLKDRAKTIPELLEKAHFILAETPIFPDEKAAKALDPVSRSILAALTPHLQNATWSRDELERVTTQVAEAHETKFGKLAGPMRAALAGRAVTPSVFDMMLVLGRDETLSRLGRAAEFESG